MTDERARPEGLLESHRALDDYLADLLRESPATPPAVSNEPPPEAMAEHRSAAGVETDRAKQSPPSGVASHFAEGARDAAGLVADWAYPEFQAQLFKVGALRLAVPVIELHGVVAWRDRLQVPPDQPRGCHGLLSYRDRMVRVIDTAALVLPAGRHELIAAGREGYILIVGDGSWGLACHSVEEVVAVAWDEVKWRSRRGKRPWLAGTALGRRYAIVDTSGFAELVG